MRERNKARTRDALVAATRELASRDGLAAVTAEQIADAAGVSRRTFFNYFSGVDALVAEATTEPVGEVIAAFLARPADEEPLPAIVAALRERPLSTDLLQWTALTCSPDGSVSATPDPVWRHHESALVQVAAQRLGDEGPLRAATLAAAVMAIFDVVHRHWVAAEGGRLDDAAVARFNDLLLEGLSHADRGWRAPA